MWRNTYLIRLIDNIKIIFYICRNIVCFITFIKIIYAMKKPLFLLAAIPLLLFASCSSHSDDKDGDKPSGGTATVAVTYTIGQGFSEAAYTNTELVFTYDDSNGKSVTVTTAIPYTLVVKYPYVKVSHPFSGYLQFKSGQPKSINGWIGRYYSTKFISPNGGQFENGIESFDWVYTLTDEELKQKSSFSSSVTLGEE